MVAKWFYLPIIFVLLNCSTNCSAVVCYAKRGTSCSDVTCYENWKTDILQTVCRGNSEEFELSTLSSFEKCGIEGVANQNVTALYIHFCEVDMYRLPKEIFGVFRNLRELLITSPRLNLLSPENFVGANQLQNLYLSGGKFNMSSSIFVNAPKLRALSITSTEVGFIDPQVFSGADALRTLQLQIRMKDPFPEGLFTGLANLQVLDLFRNDPPHYRNQIDLETFKIPAGNKIKIFSLNNGNIPELRADMFVNFTSLKVLFLNSNEIGRIQPNTFVNLNLIQLNLRRNSIQELTRAMLAGLTNLRTADFWFNQIRHIDSDAFSDMLQLRRLILSSNKITTFDPNIFNSLVKLRHLDLGFSRNHRGRNEAFDLSFSCNPPNLWYLTLRSMQLSTLKKCTLSGTVSPMNFTTEETQFIDNETAELLSDWTDLKKELKVPFSYGAVADLSFYDGRGNKYELEFSPLLDEPRTVSSASGSRLGILDLGFNELSDWEDNFFDTFVNLRLLDLSGNPIVTLRSGQFNGLVNLVILRLDECKLTSLDFNAFSPLTNLIRIYVNGNDLTEITTPTRPVNLLN